MAELGATTEAPGRRRRIGAWWRSYGWWVVGGLTLAAFLLGWAGFEERLDQLGEPHSWWDSAYFSVQLFVLESGGVSGVVPWALQVARWLAPIVFAFAAARALVALFRDQLRLLGLRFWPGHVIVCGLGDKGMSLLRSLGDTGRRIVVVERDAENDLIESARRRGALVLIGDAQDREVLRRAGVAKAAYLAAVCGADSTNAEIAVKAMRLTAERGGEPLVGVVHIVDPELCAILRTEELALPSHGGFTMEFFNIFERGAQAVLDDATTSPFGRDGADGPHLVVVGLGRFGTSVIMQACRYWSNHGEESTGELRITLVGKDAVEKKALLEERHGLSAGRLIPRPLKIESAEFLKADFLGDHPSAIFICVDDDPLAVSTALTLHRMREDSDTPIVVRVAHATGLGSLLGRESAIGGDYEALHPFGLLDETCRAEVLEGVYERMARQLQAVFSEHPPADDLAMAKEWAALSDRDKAANRALAAHTGAKLRVVECGLMPLAEQRSSAFKFTVAEIELLAILEHERWCAWTRAQGYRFGKERVDRAEFTRKYLRRWVKGRRPTLKPWDDLSKEAKDVDRDFIRKLPEVLATVDQQIVRLDETLPRAIHQAYVEDREQTGDTPDTNPSLRAWDELPETLKYANRDQAAHLRIELLGVGCTLRPLADGDGAVLAFLFTRAEREQLAVLHAEWVKEREDDRRQTGTTEDLDQELRPYHVPWAELGKAIKDFDRKVIDRLPEIAAVAGYEIVRGARSACGEAGSS